MEIGGLNYLLPGDVPKVVVGEDRVLAEASIRFNTLMDDLRDKRVRVALFIVDACRDNPFRDPAGRSVGGTRGLIRVEPAEGSFVMYSAGAGEQALDRLPGADASPNSVYTRTLLPILASPGLSLQDIAIRVRRRVVEVARGAGRKQTPAYYDQLVGDFVVLKAGAAGAPTSVVIQPPGLAAETARICREVEGMSNLATLAVLERQHKGTPAGECVAARIKQLQDIALAVPPAPKPEPPAAAFNPARAATPLTAAEERALKPKDSFKECDACPEMVVVPAGSFTMGSSSAEIEGLVKQGAEHYRSEGPQRRVIIAQPFAVGKFEVCRMGCLRGRRRLQAPG